MESCGPIVNRPLAPAPTHSRPIDNRSAGFHPAPQVMTRRDFIGYALLALPAAAAPRKWPLGINTYCLRFQRWNDRQLFDYCVAQKLDAIFLQDSLDPAVMDPKHWAEVRSWSKDLGLHLETGGGAILRKP